MMPAHDAPEHVGQLVQGAERWWLRARAGLCATEAACRPRALTVRRANHLPTPCGTIKTRAMHHLLQRTHRQRDTMRAHFSLYIARFCRADADDFIHHARKIILRARFVEPRNHVLKHVFPSFHTRNRTTAHQKKSCLLQGCRAARGWTLLVGLSQRRKHKIKAKKRRGGLSYLAGWLGTAARLRRL